MTVSLREAREVARLYLAQLPRHFLETLRTRLSDQKVGIAGAVNSEEFYLGCAASLRLVDAALAAIDQSGSTIAQQLRAAADKTPLLDDQGASNLAAWVGARTPAWYAVFSYSSPDPLAPWFCQLDLEAQRLVLLLVAAALETIK